MNHRSPLSRRHELSYMRKTRGFAHLRRWRFFETGVQMRFDTSVVEVAVPIVFVVDRHSPRRASLQSRLVEEGYHTLAMTDADETLQTLGCVRANLLVVDARAVSDGAERFLTALRSNPTYAQLPVLFVGAGLT